MAITIAMLEAMIDAGVEPDVIVATIQSNRSNDEPKRAERREKNAERMRRARAQVACVAHTNAQRAQIDPETQPIGKATVADAIPSGSLHAHGVHALADDALSSFLPSLEPRSESSEGKKERAKRNRGQRLPDEWTPKLHHFREGLELGCSQQQVMNQAEDMRLWARSNEHRAVARKSNWDATFSGWMRRNAGGDNGQSRKSGNGHRGRGFASLAAELQRADTADSS